jgi:hypothetical protein
MRETTTAANKAKTTKHAPSSFGMPDYGIPKFEMPKFGSANTEMPEAFREMAKKGVEQTRDAYARAKVASEEAVDLLENTYEAAAKRATDYNRKLIAIVHQFGAICATPGNLCLRETAWWRMQSHSNPSSGVRFLG